MASANSPTPARVLVVGGGGRENALAWALGRCPGVESVWVAPGNGGTLDLEGIQQLAIAEGDQAGLLAACQERGVELVVVGPEGPLAAGLADGLRGAGFPVFGPGADGAQLEASKQWAKGLMVEAAVPTAGYWYATSSAEALAVVEQQQQPLVVKADGLAAGKGVTVAETIAETKQAIEEVFSGRFGAAGASLVLEERMTGPEVSVFALTDGQTMVLLPPAQDHKRIGEGDTGPRVIEFNCRFGDPECETLMPLLGPELAQVLLACATGSLASAPALTIATTCSACVIAAAHGYPGTVRQGDVIEGSLTTSDRLQLFHAGTQRGPDGLCRTSGGRVLAVVAQAETFDDAFEQAYAGLAAVTYAGITYRRDIGHQVRQR